MKFTCLLLIFTLLSVDSFGQRYPYPYPYPPNPYEKPSSFPSSSTLIFLGSVTTSLSRKKSTLWFAVGWGFILFGTFSSIGREIKRILFAENTEIKFYSGQEGSSEFLTEAKSGELLQKIEMDSILAANNPDLAKALPVGELIEDSHLDVQRVGQLLVATKVLGDKILGGARYGQTLLIIPSQNLQPTLGDLSLPEHNIVKNYFRLRNIIVK